jgi:selenide,water dikinase
VVEDPNLLVGTATGDDAGVYRLSADTALVLTVDFFPPIVDDPTSFGAIAVANSLSDIYAMGGRPLLGLNIVGFPVELPKHILGDILKGGYAKAQEAGCLIIGGHTVDDREPKYGLAVVGLVEPGKQVTNAAARPGDTLVLTKPLGTGIITTAGKQGVVRREVLEEAISVMGTLNRAACEAMVSVGVNACTDVTGFGLIGHLDTMMRASGTGCTLQLSSIPVLPGAWELVGQGIAPGGTHRNLDGVGGHVRWHQEISEDGRLLLCDAQTSGGLLISVPESRAAALLGALEAGGVRGARVIGQVHDGGRKGIEVVP